MQINLEVNDLDSQFSDGVYLCLLSGLLEGYFVPLYDFHLTPQVNICFLIRVIGLDPPRYCALIG